MVFAKPGEINNLPTKKLKMLPKHPFHCVLGWDLGRKCWAPRCAGRLFHRGLWSIGGSYIVEHPLHTQLSSDATKFGAWL